MTKKKKVLFISGLAIIVVAIIAAIVYNTFTDYAFKAVLKAAEQSINQEYQREFDNQLSDLLDDFKNKILEIRKRTDLTQQEKKILEQQLMQKRKAALDKLQKSKKKVTDTANKIPPDVRSQMIQLAYQRLGADGVRKCIEMLNGGLTPEEKAEFKRLFNTKFTAAEKKKILQWVKENSK